MSRRDQVMKFFDENKEFMDGRVQAGIEAHRKGLGRITLRDGKGNPATGAKITIKQKSHAFKYGANLFMLDEFECSEKNEKYKEYFKDAFNMATLPFYWKDLEPEKGKPRYEADSPKVYRRPSPDLCLAYCEEHGIEPREHALAYEAFFPEWIKDKDTFTVKKELIKRYKDIAERYAGKIPTIEVTNEMFWPKGVTSFYDDDDYVEWCFKEAEKYFPYNKLAINESSQIWYEHGRNRDTYYMEIERALNKGARIDALGFQFHMFYPWEEELERTERVYNPYQQYKILDRYADFNLPIQITEVTIPAYSDSREDEDLQAELVEALFSIWFSHPNVEQIIYWNLVDGYAYNAPQGDMTSGENYYRGGLMGFDLTPKPAYRTIQRLFQETWHTEEEKVSDQRGVVTFNGFYGGYEICVEYNGRFVTLEAELKKNGNNEFVVDMGD